MPRPAVGEALTPAPGDRNPVLGVAVLMVVIGMDAFIIQPGFVQGLVDHGGFGEQQAGYIASAEMFGITATTILMALFGHRMSWRRVVLASLLLDAVANLACLPLHDPVAFAALRFVVGLACGCLISVGYTAVGLTANPNRNFGLLIMWVLIYGALGLFVLPSVFALGGVALVVGFFASAALVGMAFARGLPDKATSATEGGGTGTLSPTRRTLLLAGLFCYFIAQGVAWPYLALIGQADGGTEQQVALGLTISQFLGIAGAWTAAALPGRVRSWAALSAGIVGGIVPMGCFLLAAGALVFGLAVCVFNYSSNFVTPLVMAVVAAVDRTGRLVIYGVALQMLGLALGPAIAAAVIGPGTYAWAVWLSVALFTLSLILLLPPAIASMRLIATKPPEPAATP